MNFEDSVEPVTQFKSHTAQLIRRARQSGRPIIITQKGKAAAVLQDVASFQRQREALLLLKYLAIGEEQLRRGRGIPHGRVVARIRRRLRALKRG